MQDVQLRKLLCRNCYVEVDSILSYIGPNYPISKKTLHLYIAPVLKS